MILDTNAYCALVQGLPSIVSAVSNAAGLSLPLPVIAELHYGFAKGSRTAQNEQILRQFLAQPQTTVLTPTIATTEHYASLQLLCQQQGKALSHNDLWIAALARQADATLVTYDADFQVFTDVFGDKLIILAV